MTIRVKLDHFSQAQKVFTTSPDSLSAAIRGLASDIAKSKLITTPPTALTDSSTGTAGPAFVDMILPTAPFNASVAGGSNLAALNTAIGKLENAGASLVSAFNVVRATIGLPPMSAAVGTVTANTIVAQDKTVAAAVGVASVDYKSGLATMNAAKRNVERLVRACNELTVALGGVEHGSGPLNVGNMASETALEDIPTAVIAVAPGSSSIAVTVTNAFLTASANNLATIALMWNNLIAPSTLTGLTDSSGGTAAAGLVANAIPAMAAGAATTSAPKAGFDTVLAIIENNLCEVVTRMNTLRLRHSLAPYTDQTGQTADGVAAAVTNALVAVDGSTGVLAVDGVTARNRMQLIQNACSSLRVGINDLTPFYGLVSLTDALVGSTRSTTIANIAATGTGVGQDTVPNGTLLNTAVNTWLTGNRNNISTLLATLSAMSTSTIPIKPPSVVAA